MLEDFLFLLSTGMSLVVINSFDEVVDQGLWVLVIRDKGERWGHWMISRGGSVKVELAEWKLSRRIFLSRVGSARLRLSILPLCCV